MASDIVLTVRLNDEASGPLRELRQRLADLEALLPRTFCGHCGSTSFDDRRGNCSCCGAPRPLPEFKEWRCGDPPEHPNARCGFVIPIGHAGETFLRAEAAEMVWARYRALPRVIASIAGLGDVGHG
jgi:hypothetical protein